MRFFLLLLLKFNFWKEDWALGHYISTQYSHFRNISWFPKILSPLKKYLSVLQRLLENISQDVLRTSWRRVEDVLQDETLLCWKRLQNVLKTWLEDTFKTSWRQKKWGYLYLTNLTAYVSNKSILHKSITDESKANLKPLFRTQ